MKKLLMLIFGALLITGSCYAQRGDPAARLQREIEGLTTTLKLTQEQVAIVTPILKEGQTKQSEMFAKLRESGGEMNREKMREEWNKMQAETDAKLKAVLTAEQGTKLETYRKQQAEERERRMQQR
jgi:hypothetical protein